MDPSQAEQIERTIERHWMLHAHVQKIRFVKDMWECRIRLVQLQDKLDGKPEPISVLMLIRMTCHFKQVLQKARDYFLDF
jgi:hypothetical protein